MSNIVNKIMNKKSTCEKSYIDIFRKKNIPSNFNQIKLAEQLENDNIDHYISISNRSDGKTINYIHYFMDYAIRKGIGFTLIARHYTVRFSYQKILEEIIDTINTKYDAKRFHFIRNDFYVLVGYEDKEIGIITDLNQATDLKYLSNFIKKFPIMVYDEFLALEGDYLPDEWDRLKTIYSSINRKEDIPYIKYPKIFYLGNAVNFSSPILAHLDLFNKIENHKIDTMEQYDNIMLEINKNVQSNKIRNLRAFDEVKDNMTHAEFNINNHNIINKKDISLLNKNRFKVIVKLRNNYLRIEYNPDNLLTILSITIHEDEYNFNLLKKDNKEGSIFLNEYYFDDDYYKKYNRDIFRFKNQYTKDYILDGSYNLNFLKIFKIIQVYESNFLEEIDIKEEQYRDNYIEKTKENLLKKLLL